VVRVSDIEMPPAVFAILRANCATCHTYGQVDPAGYGSIIDVSRLIASDVVVPGDPDKSRLWQRVAIKGDMPFGGLRLTSSELQILKAWISNLPRVFTKPRSNEDILNLLVADQRLAANRNDTRYVSFAHFVDEHRSADELAAAGAIFSLVLNSISRGDSLVVPQPIDKEKSIFRFRLSDLGWDAADWDRITSFYPYCLRSDQAAHRNLYNQLRTEAPVVRGDWFVATADKPPLYFDLLQIPQNTDDFVRNDLGVDVNNDIQNGRIQRIGFRSSGVSLHGRILERHTQRVNGTNTYFWTSYDFDTDVDQGDILRNPLGPVNRDNTFQASFQNLAGETFFSLRNGLQGYFLSDSNGNRLDKAVQTVVRDRRRQDGSVESGISCFNCHGKSGMNTPKIFDEIPTFAQQHQNEFTRQELDEIRRTYPTNGQEILQADALRYQTKARQLLGDLLPGGGGVEYDDFITLTGEFEAKVGFRGGAIELQTDFATLNREVQVRGGNEGDLPISVSDPLVTRDDFTCRFRRIIRDVRNVQFCANTFNAVELNGFCDNR
jgi:cytochrome c553